MINRRRQVIMAAMMGGVEMPWYLLGGVNVTNCLGAYKATGAADLATSYINLANPGTYDLTAPTAAPTWDSTDGWTFDGVSQYLATGITPTDHRTYTVVVKFSGLSGASTGYAWGWYASGGFCYAPSRTNQTIYAGTTVNGWAYANIVGGGVAVVAGDKFYLNSGLMSPGLTTETITQREIYLGASKKSSGSPPIHTYFGGKIQAFAVYNIVLTASQVIAVTEALNSINVTDGAPEASIIVISDSQVYIHTESKVASMANWIVANSGPLNLLAVLHTGDVIDTASDIADWDSAEVLWGALDAASIPFLISPGNHDDNWTNWNTYHPQSRYTGRTGWNGGFYEVNHSENAYMILGDYLFISLQWVVSDAILAWAAGVMAANPTKKVILISHSWEFIDGSLTTAGDAEAPDVTGGDSANRNPDEMWTLNFKSQANMIMGIGGHHLLGNAARHESTGDNGNKVLNTFSNWQSLSYYYPFVRIYKFYNGGTTVKVSTINLWKSEWKTDADNQFTVTYS